MSKKLDLKKNISVANIGNFDNKAPLKKKKKTLMIRCNKMYIDNYIKFAFNYYKEQKRLKDYSYSNFFIIGLNRVEEILKSRYGALKEPTEDYLKFFRTKSKVKLDDNLYPKDYLKDLDKINFFIEEEYSDLTYKLLYNFYINEREGLSNYSISLFFCDMLNLLEEEGV